VWLIAGPLDRRGGSFKYRNFDRSIKVATWLIDSQGAQAWNKGYSCYLLTNFTSSVSCHSVDWTSCQLLQLLMTCDEAAAASSVMKWRASSRVLIK